MAEIFRLKGHQLQIAYDGPTALEIAGEFIPEVALLDIGMPGIDGYDLASQLRQLPGLERCLLIAVTGYGQEEDRICSREAGFDYHLVKPASIQIIEELLTRAVATTAIVSVDDARNRELVTSSGGGLHNLKHS